MKSGKPRLKRHIPALVGSVAVVWLDMGYSMIGIRSYKQSTFSKLHNTSKARVISNDYVQTRVRLLILMWYTQRIQRYRRRPMNKAIILSSVLLFT